MQDNLLPIQVFDEFYELDKIIDQHWERLQNGDKIPSYNRPIIASSWERSKNHGINPFAKQAPLVHQQDSLIEKRQQYHILLDAAMPHIEQLFSVNSKISWFITDPDGIVLDLKTNNMRLAEKLEFLPGVDTSERACGTNAIGLALINKLPVQVLGAEHFIQSFRPFIASAAPICDPISKQTLGILSMVAEKNVVHGHDILLLLQIINSIEMSIGLTLREQNSFAMEVMIEMMHEPFLLFNIDGIIIRHNKSAKHFFEIQAGDPLNKVMEMNYSLQEWQDMLLKGIKGNVQGKDGGRWDVQFQPYTIGANLYGGMALFQKCKAVLPTRPSKAKRLRYDFDEILTQSQSMLQVIQLGQKVAISDKNVFITGETGTGKEMLAQSIHSHGPRCQGPFVEVNCGAIPKDLVASELFGYEGGSFTGAKSQGKKGKFLLADQGTIFLDEIGDLPLDSQVYLLRVLEERSIIPIGASQSIPINVRVIAATHKNLEAEVKKGNFREDLYYRLNVISLKVPSLRDRADDIPYLVQYFLKQSYEGELPPIIDPEVMDILCAYSWPGNIRQLKNIVERMVFHANDGHIQLKDLPSEIHSSNMTFHPSIEGKQVCGSQGMIRRKKIDRETLVETLTQTNGNISKAASILNVGRKTIYRKLQEFNLYY